METNQHARTETSLEHELRRRSILAGTAGVAGVAGCAGTSEDTTGVTESESPTLDQQSTPESSRSSGRWGDTVYYDPTNRGPYSDGQAALADVPDGGRFRIAAGDYNLDEEGPLHVDRPVHVIGAGPHWSRMTLQADGDRDINYKGTRIFHNDAVDAPGIAFQGTESSQIQGVTLQGFKYFHGETNAPAIRFQHTINSVTKGISVYSREADVGVEYGDATYFARMLRTNVGGRPDISIHVTGGGYSHEFYSCWAATGAPDGVAFQTENHRSIVLGGEYASLGDNGTAIRFFNPNDYTLKGGFVAVPGIEHTQNHVDIDGENPCEGVEIYHTLITLTEEGDRGIRFGNARNCKLIYPVLPRTRKGEIAHWSDQSESCGIVSDPGTMAYCTYTDEGAVNPWISLSGNATDRHVENLPTGIPLSVEFNRDAGAPLVHDGSEWRAVQTRAYSPGE
jgi:hypothetical protein